jgi:hypothetical protein
LQLLPAGKTAAMACTQGGPVANFERINDTWSVATKQPAIVRDGASVTFAGWALNEDQSTLAAGVDLVIDGQPFAADYGGERDDVASYLKIPAARDSGFRFLIPAGWILSGQHTAVLRVISKNTASYREGASIAFNVQ